MSRERLLAAAAALPPEDRARLAVEILETLDGPADADAAAAWGIEIRRRLERLKTGQTGTTPAAEVFASAREP